MEKYLQYLVGTTILVLTLTTHAAAAGFYLGVHGGAGLLPDAGASDPGGRLNFSYGSGYDGSFTLGYDLGTEHPDIGKGRVEFEFNRASNDIDKAEFIENKAGVDGSVERTSIMINTIGEYTTRSGMIIYALVGLGWAEVSLDNISILGEPFVDDSNSQLAYQAGIGLGWNLSDHFVFDIGYRYYGTIDPEFTEHDGTPLDYEYTSHRILAGFRVHF